MTPLTPWHYIVVGVLGLVFILGTVLALRSDSRVSILATVTLVITLIGVFLWHTINESVYRVEISNLHEERFYQSEQILIKGTVRNVGKYPVGRVKAVVRLSNTRGVNEAKASQFAQPGAFAELFEDDNPEFKRQNVIEEHVIVDHLSPGSSKSFRIMMNFPSHFTRVAYTVDAEID